MMLPLITKLSAGICSPAPTISTSPTTISSMESSVSTPSLQTLKRPAEHSSSSLLNAASLPRSERVDISVARKTDMPIPIVSIISPPLKTKKRFIISAPSSILITGSPRFSKKLLIKLLPFFFFSALEPFFFLDASASALVNPCVVFSVEPIISSPLYIPCPYVIYMRANSSE